MSEYDTDQPQEERELALGAILAEAIDADRAAWGTIHGIPAANYRLLMHLHMLRQAMPTASGNLFPLPAGADAAQLGAVLWAMAKWHGLPGREGGIAGPTHPWPTSVPATATVEAERVLGEALASLAS